MSARVSGTPRRRPPPPPPPHIVQKLTPTATKLVTIIWAPSSQYLATALQQGPILLFAVVPTSPRPLRASPVRTFRGHTADVLHLSFSRTNFLASASMDRTVRLWHPHSAHCLRRFAHPDMVTSLAFRPDDDNVLLTAGCDAKARLYRVSDERIMAMADAGAVVTATAFVSQNEAVVGTYDGRLLAWSTPKLPAVQLPSLEWTAGTAASGQSSPPRPTVTLPPAEVFLEPLHDVLFDARRQRRARKPSAAKISAIVPQRGGRMVVSASDARMFCFAERQVVKRVRPASLARREFVPLQTSVSPDGRFALLEACGGEIRMADLAAADASRRREKEVSVVVHSVPVVEGAEISCAAFAGDGVAERIGSPRATAPDGLQEPESETDVAASTVAYLAVGAQDGTLRIVKMNYRPTVVPAFT